MHTLLKPLQVRETLLNKGVHTFTANDFETIFRVSGPKVKYFLETQAQDGLLIRLKKGTYALKTDLPSELEIANRLYRPSYVSFEYALAYWGIIPEMPYAITSATTKPTRQFIVNGKGFMYFTIKLEAYTGYQLINVNLSNLGKRDNYYLSESINNDTNRCLLAEPEKALVDYLYFVSLGKKQLSDRLYIRAGSLNKTKLKVYAAMYNRKKLSQLIKDYL